MLCGPCRCLSFVSLHGVCCVLSLFVVLCFVKRCLERCGRRLLFLVVTGVLSVVCYFVVCDRWLLVVVCCLLSVDRCLVFVVCCLLFGMCCWLLGVGYC